MKSQQKSAGNSSENKSDKDHASGNFRLDDKITTNESESKESCSNKRSSENSSSNSKPKQGRKSSLSPSTSLLPDILVKERDGKSVSSVSIKGCNDEDNKNESKGNASEESSSDGFFDDTSRDSSGEKSETNSDYKTRLLKNNSVAYGTVATKKNGNDSSPTSTSLADVANNGKDSSPNKHKLGRCSKR